MEGFENYGYGQSFPQFASYASLFMVRGLMKKWKQLFGFFFSSGSINFDSLKSLLIEGVNEVS